MAVVIASIVTETAVAPEPDAPPNSAAVSEADVDLIVRRATERVLEILRREWDT